MINVNYVPNPVDKLLQKLEVNLASLSEIIVLGKPCNLKISFIKKLTTYIALKVDFIGIK